MLAITDAVLRAHMRRESNRLKMLFEETKKVD